MRYEGYQNVKSYFSGEVFSDNLLDFRDSSGSADENDFVNVVLLHLAVLHHVLEWLHGRSEQVHVQLLELRARQGLAEIVTLLERMSNEYIMVLIKIY